MESPNPLRVGLVGCGRQGRNLAEAVRRIPTMRLTGAADPLDEATSSIAALTPGLRTYSSVEQLLRSEEVDAVFVATPHHLLQPVALAAIRAGKHVLVEKPVALNAQQAQAIVDAVAQKRICFLAGYSFRFSLGKSLRELLNTGVVGEIQAICGSIGLPPMNSGWAATPETGGGPLLYLGSHLVDLALWYANDEPCAVSADVRWRQDTGADDSTALQIRFTRGATAQLLVTQSASTFFFSLDIIGRAGQLTVRGWSLVHFEIEVLSNAVPAYAQPTLIRPRIFGDIIAAMFVPELEEFASAIREGREPSVTARDAHQVLQVLDAAVGS